MILDLIFEFIHREIMKEVFDGILISYIILMGVGLCIVN